MATEVLIPPWVLPETPERIKPLDDSSESFEPGFGRGFTQVQVWGDPRWQLTRRYRALRSDQKAAILSAINDARGKGVVVRATPHTPVRGSFPATEALSNHTFESGTTGWTGTSTTTRVVGDRVMRVTRNQVGATSNALGNSSAATVTQYAPYLLRTFLKQGRGSYPTGHALTFGSTAGAADYTIGSDTTNYGLLSLSHTVTASTVFVGIRDRSTSGQLAGDYVEIPYMSLSRCALVDDGPNMLLQSDAFDNAAWSKIRCTCPGNNDTAPDGTVTGDRIIEDSTASSTHLVVTAADLIVSSGVADYAYAVALRAGTRTWAAIEILEQTGLTALRAYFNLSTGAVGTTSAGANWSNLRAFSQSLGNGWYYCGIVGRKTNAATLLSARVYLATADNTNSYTGDGASYITAWRATLAQASVPTRLVGTTTTATTGTSQTGSALYIKGLPASTDGLLETNDWFSINGELKQCTARLSSDGAGLGYLQFRPALVVSPANGDPIEINVPWGRFRLMNGAEYDNLFGLYADIQLELTESYT